MPNPQAGKTPMIVKPTKPTAPQDADTADPGQVESVEAGSRDSDSIKYGSTKVKPHKPNSEENKEKKNWIEVHLVDDDGEPVPGESVEIVVPDGSVASGSTNEEGKFKVTNIDPGNCKITFINLDQEAWEPA